MAEVLEFKCPSCQGALQFDSSAQEMKCRFCNSEFNVEEIKKYNEALNSQDEDETEWEQSQNVFGENEEADIYICNSCGGEIITDKTTAATHCPFCENPVVFSRKVSGGLKPDYVIPFKLDKDVAKRNLLEHFKGKRLLPKTFKNENRIDEIKGIYVPFWLFDTGVDADIRFRGTRVHHWSDGDYDYDVIDHYAIIRKGKIAFERVPVDGSSKMPDDLMESLEPFDHRDAVSFETAYLAGYFADKYDVDSDSSIERANQRIKHSTESEFRKTVHGFGGVYVEHSSLRHFNGKVRYALYPVWLLNTTYKGEKFTFAMNGQTGKFVGDLPMDKGAFWKWFGIIAGSVTAGVFGVLYLLGKLGGVL